MAGCQLLASEPLPLGAGATAGALRRTLGDRFGALQGHLFALIGRHHIVIGPPDAAAAAGWAKHVARAGR